MSPTKALPIIALILASLPLFGSEQELASTEWTGTIELIDSGACTIPKKSVPTTYQIAFNSPSEFTATPILPITKLPSPNGIIRGVVSPDGTVKTTTSIIVTCDGKDQTNSYQGTGALNGQNLEFTVSENVCPQFGCTFVRKYKLSKSGI